MINVLDTIPGEISIAVIMIHDIADAAAAAVTEDTIRDREATHAAKAATEITGVGVGVTADTQAEVDHAAPRE